MVVPPRVLIVMADQWPRALLRAALRELGYDALAASDLEEALSYPASDAKRGPVRLVILDQRVMGSEHESLLTRLMDRFGQPATLLLASTMTPPTNISGRVIQRPASIADITRAVQTSLAVPTASARPID
jgi:DNA-binding response OmpR family regulator